MQHLELVRAYRAEKGAEDAVAVHYPSTWDQLKSILNKLAYDVDAVDPWRRLGLAMYQGPDPSASVISFRKRTALLLCGLAAKVSWSESDRAAAERTVGQIGVAAACCEDLLQTPRMAIGKSDNGSLSFTNDESWFMHSSMSGKFHN